MAATAFFVATVGGACGGGSGIRVPAPPAQARGDFTVEISRAPSGGGHWITLSEDAYVAVFRVKSNRGAVVYYPYTLASSQRFSAGQNSLSRGTIDEEREYDDRAYLAFPEERNSIRTFLLVVASPSALGVAALMNDPLLLEGTLDGRYDEVSMLEAIFDFVVPQRQTRPWGWACLGESLDGPQDSANGLSNSVGRSQGLNRLRLERQCPLRGG